MKAFIQEWAWQVIAILFFLLFLGRGCTSSKIERLDQEVKDRNIALVKNHIITFHFLT